MSAVLDDTPLHPESAPLLRVLRDDRVVTAFRLRGHTLTIGRSDATDLALPSDTVSRVHCVLERREDGWWVVDRSRHGTLLHGLRVAASHLAVGDRVQVGAYVLELGPGEQPEDAGVTRRFAPADHEELLGVGRDGATACRAVARVVRGPRSGSLHELARARSRVGGPGAHVELGPELPPDAVILQVVRGRVLVEPGAWPAFLGGQRVREPTPALPGEALRVGDHVLELDTLPTTVEEAVTDRFGELVGRSSVMLAVFEVLSRVSRHDATVLLAGESGTGKELAAQAIASSGHRAARPFVAINCASIPEGLIESELFGHEAGAFTGADARRDGAFQRAHGGTLFLDELGELSAGAQARLLRAIESGEVRRVGGDRAEHPDVRLIAATHRDLGALVREGRFRADLLFRLAVLTVRLPALREHPEDIKLISDALLQRYHPGARVTDRAMKALRSHTWPGNVRELRNVLTRAVVLGGPVVDVGSLSYDAWAFAEADAPGWSADEAERTMLVDVLHRCQGNRSAASRELGLARTSFLYKLRKHGLDGGR